jgi:RNA polymerase sigma-70 factor, ECF subfamily
MTHISEYVSDDELIHRLRAGQQSALQILYQRYSGLVYTIAFTILNHAGDAEDLIQEVFLNFWQKGNFDPNRATLSTYLSMLTRSQALNKLESRSSRQRSLQRLQNETFPPQASTPTPLEQASLAEQEQTLQHALAQLPQNQRHILEMNFYQGLSQTAIAKQLAMPLGTVKTNARKGLIKLRELLGDAVE